MNQEKLDKLTYTKFFKTKHISINSNIYSYLAAKTCAHRL